MFAMTVWSAAVPYTDGSCPSVERFYAFVEWYSDPTVMSLGWLTRTKFLSGEMVAASLDSAVLRLFDKSGCVCA